MLRSRPGQVLGGALVLGPTGPVLTLPSHPRVEWAQARKTFFSSGKNRAALDAIERAAFFVVLDEESHSYDPENEASLSLYGKALLHGNCYNRYSPAPLLPSLPPASVITTSAVPAGGSTSPSPSWPSRMASWVSTRNTHGQTPLSWDTSGR